MGAKLRTRSHVFWSKAIWSTDISPTQRKLRKKFVDSFCVEQIILRPVKIGELSGAVVERQQEKGRLT